MGACGGHVEAHIRVQRDAQESWWGMWGHVEVEGTYVNMGAHSSIKGCTKEHIGNRLQRSE